MAEDAGKKRFIRDFLQRIKPGDGFYDDMRIERFIRPPGTSGEGSTAQSLSGKTINNITELLEDDLRHSFDDGYFTFRLVNAQLGSGKTALLRYLEELAKTKPTYENFSVVRFFRLSDLISISSGQNFSVKFYCHILSQTFLELLNNPNQSVENTAKKILNDYLGSNEVTQLVAIKNPSAFRSKFSNCFAQVGVVFEEFFFEVIKEISKVEPQFTFAYLIDDLDHLKDFPGEFQETKSLIKSMVRAASQTFDSKVRLLVYLAGTSENILKFLSDSVIHSLVGNLVVVLSKGYGNEFEKIRAKIDGRIEGAFKGYKNFDKAWKEIKSIPINSAQNLRAFYQYYATEVLKIYEKYFKEEPEKQFEGNARELIESQCRQKWEKYLNKKSYTLSSCSTTTVLAGHAFDCYTELRHNGSCVARCFGEAKNYDLLSSHLETFDQWLKDLNFKPFTADGTPPDLAFMIAPDSPPLLQRKLELKNIGFIPSIIVNSDPTPKPPTVKSSKNSVNINTAEKEVIIKAFKGTGIKGKTVEKLMNYRENKQYKDIGELASDLNLNQNVRDKLQKKPDKGEICFSSE